MNKTCFISFILLILYSLFCGNGFCVPADVTDISNRDYTDAVVNILNDSKDSIFMVMYLISFAKEDTSGNVYRLMNALKSARDRGVAVKVILDYRSGEDMEEGSVSYYAYKFLKDAGIIVKFDTARVYTHNKTIIVDNKIVISGSANWSQAALERSNETNFIIESPEIAQMMIKRFNEIELIPEKNEEKEIGILIPLELMRESGVFQEMVRRNDERSFDIYLLMLKRFTPGTGGKINITYEDISREIGMKREDYRNMLNHTLRKLDNRYRLIKADIKYGKPVEITLLKLGTDTGLNNLPAEECIKFPVSYWTYGWAGRLNLSEKFSLFINLSEIGSQTEWNEWMLTREQMEEKYGISASTITKGMLGLMRFRIIDVTYGEIDKGYSQRMPAVTRFLGLYNWDEFEKSLADLEAKYGKDAVCKSRKYADIVFRSHDIESIEDIIKFTKIYGNKKVAEAFKKVGMKAIDNPKRAFKYVVGILKNQ